MARTFDLIVIGTGTAATTAAMRCRDAGWRVAVVDHRPFGGTCALRGCDPKKILVGAASAIDRLDCLEGHGIRRGGAQIDWAALIAFERTFTDPVPEAKANRYAREGIDALTGRARFTGRNAIEVDGESLEARHVVIAAGAEPMRLGIDGEDCLITSDDFLTLERLPQRIVFVGGGYIAFEFAHIACRAGAHVTLVEQAPEVLAPFDQDLVGWLVERTQALGIEVRTRTAVESIRRDANGRFRVAASAEDRAVAFDADLVVHAAGRVPALDALRLEAAGIERADGRLVLNEYLQSVSNPAIYAAGDAAQVGPPLTPVASRDGDVVATNLLEGNRVRPEYAGVPSVVFTVPPLASTGLTERAARERSLRFRVHCEQTAGWYSNRRLNETAAGFKVLIEHGTDRVLGAHLLGPEADEVINVFALAIRLGLTASDLRQAVFAYPTGASDIAHML
jgi:glutathione reductase (NADPH)